MTKTIIYVLVIGLLGAGGFFIYQNQNAKNTNSKSGLESENTIPLSPLSENTNQELNPLEGLKGGKISLSEIIARKGKGSYACIINENINGVTTEGTMFIDNGKTRVDMKTFYNNKLMSETTAVVPGDGYSYSVTSMDPQNGFKAKIPANQGQDENVNELEKMLGVAKDEAYDCSVWQADSSKFILPSGVNFKLVN